MSTRTELPEHLFIGDGGELFDTRIENWTSKPLRKNYCRSHQHINTVTDLKATLRNGSYAWPGGYPMYFITSDGGALSFDSVREELRNVVDSIKTKCNDGWRVVACDINWEDGNLVDDHSNERIESAYAEPDTIGDDN